SPRENNEDRNVVADPLQQIVVSSRQQAWLLNWERVQTWQKGANLAEGYKRCEKWVFPLHLCTFPSSRLTLAPFRQYKTARNRSGTEAGNVRHSRHPDAAAGSRARSARLPTGSGDPAPRAR